MITVQDLFIVKKLSMILLFVNLQQDVQLVSAEFNLAVVQKMNALHATSEDSTETVITK